MSIQLRTILVMNVFVAGMATVMVFISRQTAGRVVEERLASQLAVGVSTFLQGSSFPLSDTMMENLRDLFHTDWITTDAAGQPVASSLPAAGAAEFQRQIGAIDGAGQARLDGRLYRVASRTITRTDVATTRPRVFRLFMLVPDAQLESARDEAAAQMFKVFVPVLILATIAAFLLSFTITRPIRQLVREMDELAEQASSPSARRRGLTPSGRPSPRGAIEITHLTCSFRHLLERLDQARENLARSERLAALGRTSLSVAHELRNPLSGIKMNVRVLKDELAEPAGQILDIILREIDRMDLYLQELMSLAQGSAARGGNRARLRLSELAEGVLTLLSGRCRHARVHVERRYSTDEPAVLVHGDSIRQAIMNLLVNAIEATGPGGTLTVSVRAGMAGARFEVADGGAGVQCAPGQDIFDAFESGKPNGVGLGLFIAREAIDREGGKIGYENAPGGAVFWLELPRAEGDFTGSESNQPAG